MSQHEATREDAIDEAVAAAGADVVVERDVSRWEARLEIEWHRAETERLRVLVDFLNKPIHAHGGLEPDSDIVTAYNLAVEAALNGIRRAAAAQTMPTAL